MRLKIVGDGTPHGTRIVNADTGEPVERVASLALRCDAETDFAMEATLTVLLIEADVVVEVDYAGEYRRPTSPRRERG